MVDYLVVGFGISGLSIQRYLQQSNLSYRVIADQSQTASLAAGGLVNPVMLKTGKLLWDIKSFLPYAIDFYKKKSELDFSSYPIHRVFNSVQEQNQYLSFSTNLNDLYITGELVQAYHSTRAPYKMSKVNGGGVINIQKILTSQKQQLIQNKQLNNETFDFDLLSLQNNHLEYNGQQYRYIIFAEGFGFKNNPFFNVLPIQGNKGEYIILESEELQLKAILKNKYFLIPLGNNLYKYGATYSRGQCDSRPTDEAKLELITHLDLLIKCHYKIVGQVAGIRPTVKDKKPIYGSHPKYHYMYFFNGMGSRGLLMAPLLAHELIAHIQYKEPLREEVDIKRFKSFF